MLSSLKKLLGIGPKADYAAMVSEGAVIVDVRSPDEFRSGHIKGALNIPLPSLQSNLAKLKKEKTIITCCASGMRSAAAKNVLKSKGYTSVYNGGGWMGLQHKIR